MIKISSRNIKYSENVSYLGICIGTRMSIGKHVDRVGAKAKRMFTRMKAISGKEWGLRNETIVILYRAVFLPIMLYAAGAWVDLMNGAMKVKCNKYQRMALLAITGAYRTVSTMAIQVAAGELPLDIEATRRYYWYKIRKEECFEYKGVRYDGKKEKKEIKNMLNKEFIIEWQRRWSESDKGRQTFKFFSNIEDRMRKEWLRPDHYTMQFITEHGDFASKLEDFGLRHDDKCGCGEVETVEHLLWKCKNYTEEEEL